MSDVQMTVTIRGVLWQVCTEYCLLFEAVFTNTAFQKVYTLLSSDYH